MRERHCERCRSYDIGRIRHAQCTPLPGQPRRETSRRRPERGQYENYYFSTVKQDDVEGKLKTIHEKLEQVKRAIGDDNLREAVEIEYNDIAPIYENIQKNDYEVNEVDVKEEKDGTILARLRQEPVHFSKTEIKLS